MLMRRTNTRFGWRLEFANKLVLLQRTLFIISERYLVLFEHKKELITIELFVYIL